MHYPYYEQTSGVMFIIHTHDNYVGATLYCPHRHRSSFVSKTLSKQNELFCVRNVIPAGQCVQ